MSFPEPQAFDGLYDGVSEILFTVAQIENRVAELGEAISRDYNGTRPLLVGVLKGVFPFIADLVRWITIPIEVDFLAIASYSPDTRKRGVVRLQKDLEQPIAGRHVLFIEDVVDTGLTLHYILNQLKSRDPASLEVCTMFDKGSRRLIKLPIRYKGFDLPDRFVVGYGLDYRELYRNLPFVGLLKAEVFRPEDIKEGSSK
ncbi:MAG: hypoxanthine phosphoribosyltransferase [Candidatus Promineofilum sp.]|nr:hypoxanthine phosphoribosyltransferase [Promineifilum sp.]